MEHVRSQTYYSHYLAICNAKRQCDIDSQIGKACLDYFKNRLTDQEYSDLYYLGLRRIGSF